ncbi:maleylpyruvate isomerase family mycothiol-dependent enzyme [Labedella phragmitis]|uniref:Maleylpyruvate isomerase family mycothiol-dependent enzyme n=1 Tax=Labedella phragmitis TaxID=2498849 RepID=A0A3S4BIC5_9MICO|nr:maleylpyruvate isomerase family mycothiol-dependent enzyme [Labedella phragmitis]RWZ50829.1 maleylpyruvate isomerase family mycothiol-dependent enzyme [Labedella phragmitis]
MAGRTDNVTDPALAAGLLVARRGQAFYSRKLNELTDDDLDAPSLLPQWSRRQVVAHVGLNARALTRLTEWAATGIETPMYDSPEQRTEEIDFAATLPAQALRNLSDHAAIHLNVEWRDLPETAWANEVRTAHGRVVPVSETVWMRTREVWIHAVDLGNGASFRDIPAEVIDRLLDDVQSAWATRAGSDGRPPMLEATDRPRVSSTAAAAVQGPAWRLAAWATGRGSADGLSTSDGAPLPSAPRWL